MHINKPHLHVVHVSIPNWEKYNPRADRANYNWFRFENSFFIDQTVFGLSLIEKMVFIFVACEFSKKNGELTKLHLNYVSQLTGLCDEDVVSALIALQECGLVTCENTDLAGILADSAANPRQSAAEKNHNKVNPPRTAAKRRLTKRNVTVRDEKRQEFNETYICQSEEETRPQAAAEVAAASTAPHRLLETWNQWCGTLPKAISTAGRRRAAAEARWKEQPSEEYWSSVVQKIANSQFCSGQGSTGWRASFDWFLKPDNHIKVMEGKYDDVERQRPKSSAQHAADHARDQIARIRSGQL